MTPIADLVSHSFRNPGTFSPWSISCEGYVMRRLLGLAVVLLLIAPIVLLYAAPVPKQRPAPKEGPLGMKFVPLPKGTFYMGWDGREGSAKRTEIDEAFEISIHTVTQGQWEAVMGTNPSWFSRKGKGRDKVKDISDEDLKRFPVEMVSWDDCQVFLKKLNEQENGKIWLYRLPHQKEWEYACRGGATSDDECYYHFYFDLPTNDLSPKQANFNGNQPDGNGQKGPYLERTTKVGSYPPNKQGFYDMHGNVRQWCTDKVHVAPVPKIDTWACIVRGGDWSKDGKLCRTGHSELFTASEQTNTIGLRLVRVPSPPTGK